MERLPSRNKSVAEYFHSDLELSLKHSDAVLMAEQDLKLKPVHRGDRTRGALVRSVFGRLGFSQRLRERQFFGRQRDDLAGSGDAIGFDSFHGNHS